MSALEPCSSLGAIPFCLDALFSWIQSWLPVLHPEIPAGRSVPGVEQMFFGKRCCFPSLWQRLQKELAGKQHIESWGGLNLSSGQGLSLVNLLVKPGNVAGGLHGICHHGRGPGKPNLGGEEIRGFAEPVALGVRAYQWKNWWL